MTSIFSFSDILGILKLKLAVINTLKVCEY